MPDRAGRAVDHPLRDVFALGAVGGLGDEQLLGRFVAGDGPAAAAAFDVLMRRHGPMVRAACQVILRDRHEAEDAAQATFLVLARNARSIRRPEALAPWLLGVARRVAIRLKAQRHRRQTVGREVARRADERSSPAEGAAEGVAALEEEVARLPARLQAPLLLCALGGMSYDDAARTLGTSPASVRGRLARARQRLHDRLTRRGVVPGEAGSSLALAARPAAFSEGPSAAWRQAILDAAGRAPGAGSGWVFTFFSNRWEITAMQANVIKAAAVLLAAAGGVLTYQAGVRPGAAVFGAAPQSPAARPDFRPDPTRLVPGLDPIRGSWARVATQGGGITRILDSTNPTLRLEISEAGFRFGLNESPETAHLDPARTPKVVELTPTGESSGPLRGKTYFGIYAVEGDTLMLCLDIHEQSEHPREFASRPGDRLIVDIYRRVKP